MKDKIVVVTLAMSYVALALKDEFAEDKIPTVFTGQSPIPIGVPQKVSGLEQGTVPCFYVWRKGLHSYGTTHGER